MSLRALWRRNLGLFKFAILSNIEYRLNFVVDAIVQPSITMLIEFVLWTAIFKSIGSETLNGYSLPFYLGYALWASFLGRISSNWMYEFRMVEEVESGTVNSVIVRPLSFFEYYLSQLLGYKFITTAFSFLVPLGMVLVFSFPSQLTRLPLAILLVFYYLIFIYCISFVVSCFAFFLNRVSSFTVAKNLAMWILTGELLPLDLVPEPYRQWVISLPFCAGVYIPAGYITGRLDISYVLNAFSSVTIGILTVGICGAWLWRRGLKTYAGTGA